MGDVVQRCSTRGYCGLLEGRCSVGRGQRIAGGSLGGRDIGPDVV